MLVGALLALSMVAGIGPVGCGKRGDQSTPEATIATARTLVERGDARQLSGLIYAENDDMRRLLNTTGRLMGNLEALARELQAKYPAEVSALRERAQQAAAEGKSTSIFGQLVGGARQAGGPGGGRVPGAGGPQADRGAFDDALTRILVDPYAFLRESEGRLTTEYLSDDEVALLWDEEPVLAPVGMIMRKTEDGRWYFELPISAPALRRFMPSTPEQYRIMGGLISVFDKVVVDLTTEVRNGQLPNLEAVSRRAGEMTFLPAVLTFYAYSRLRDEQRPAGEANDRPGRSQRPSPAPAASAPTGG